MFYNVFHHYQHTVENTFNFTTHPTLISWRLSGFWCFKGLYFGRRKEVRTNASGEEEFDFTSTRFASIPCRNSWTGAFPCSTSLWIQKKKKLRMRRRDCLTGRGDVSPHIRTSDLLGMLHTEKYHVRRNRQPRESRKGMLGNLFTYPFLKCHSWCLKGIRRGIKGEEKATGVWWEAHKVEQFCCDSEKD